MKFASPQSTLCRRLLTFAAPALIAAATCAAEPVLTIDADKPTHDVSPKFFGLMTEEINHSYDGGIYAELIQNRIFKDDPKAPAHWSVVQRAQSNASIALDESQQINSALTVCLKLDAQGGGGIANDGYWGIPVKPQTTYRASFFAKTDSTSAGALTVSIESNDGATVFAKAQVPKLTHEWQRYNVTLTTRGDAKPSTNNRFVISTTDTGTFWFNLVSLFPPTFNNRPNGNRIDLMQLLGEMQPNFLRLPGGNYVEGDHIDTHFKWKETLGDLAQRPGHPGCWHYRSSDGMGLLEFLEWCEDLKMEPVLAVYAGYSLRGEHVNPGPDLKPYIDEALDEIEYVTGDIRTKWGAQRAKDGHPNPFKLTYVEIGNEDGFDKSGSYEGRYVQFYDAIKAKYPKLQLISTVGGRDSLGKRFTVKQRTPDVLDEHYYRKAVEMEEDAAHYDNYDRNGPKIFVGEWATREGSPTTNLNAALGDAAWLTGMERNSDLVVLQCYAPLFVNVNRGGMQWSGDLIGYDALNSYGSPSYYTQKMFNQYLGDKVVPVKGDNIPTQTWQPPAPKDKPAPPAKELPSLFYVATRDSKTGNLYLKVVNIASTEQALHIEVKGAHVAPQGTAVVLTSARPEDTNSINEPTKIVPVTSKADGLGNSFTRTFAPYSINVLQLQTK
ncbi:MAG TPA: alpha-L-arabinofuranosidase C-terminal domain-containing protein [Bryobacteraceae bacterium]|nr:alpha-L-arabinofuranosidase C-terminal domain-containing protein [Bryobacteraceae bacterium]